MEDRFFAGYHSDVEWDQFLQQEASRRGEENARKIYNLNREIRIPKILFPMMMVLTKIWIRKTMMI
jgi:hypothetical protein